MLKKQDIDKLKALGIDAEKLSAAIADTNEVDFVVPDGKMYTDAQIDELKGNVKASHEKDYGEIYLRKLNKDHELGLTGADAKDEKKILASLREKAVKEAGIAPNQKIKELEDSIAKLQNEVIPAEQAKVKDWESKYKERETYDKYASLVPKGANPLLTTAEHVNRIKGLYSLNEDGSLTDVATGKVVKDNLEKSRAASEVIAETYKNKEGWLQGEQTKQPFHHSTQGGFNNNGKFNSEKTFEAISAKYDMNTMEGRQMAQNEFTAAQVNAAKN